MTTNQLGKSSAEGNHVMQRNHNLRIIEEAFLNRDQEQIFNMVPRVHPDECARGIMGVCIGFIVGLAVSGEVERANDYADSLIQCLAALDREISKFDLVLLSRDSARAAMSFDFIRLRPFTDMDDDSKIIIYNNTRYMKDFNGGMIFHGLNNQTFAVSVTALTGWQLHT